MSSLDDAIGKLKWSSECEWSASITPAECQAVLNRMQELEAIREVLEEIKELYRLPLFPPAQLRRDQ